MVADDADGDWKSDVICYGRIRTEAGSGERTWVGKGGGGMLAYIGKPAVSRPPTLCFGKTGEIGQGKVTVVRGDECDGRNWSG